MKPATTVPVRLLRDKSEKTLNVTIGELDLEAEGQRAAGDSEDEGDANEGFGITLGNLTADRARRMGVPSGTSGALITDVDPNGSAARAGVRPGDIILQVNRKPVASAAEAVTRPPERARRRHGVPADLAEQPGDFRPGRQGHRVVSHPVAGDEGGAPTGTPPSVCTARAAAVTELPAGPRHIQGPFPPSPQGEPASETLQRCACWSYIPP